MNNLARSSSRRVTRFRERIERASRARASNYEMREVAKPFLGFARFAGTTSRQCTFRGDRSRILTRNTETLLP